MIKFAVSLEDALNIDSFDSTMVPDKLDGMINDVRIAGDELRNTIWGVGGGRLGTKKKKIK